MEVAEDICDRIGIIVEGTLVAEGTMDELRHRTSSLGKDADLEDMFLKLTNQDESVNEIIEKLRNTVKRF